MLTKNLVLDGARLPIEDASNEFFLSFCKNVGQVIFDLCCSDVFLEQIYMLAEQFCLSESLGTLRPQIAMLVRRDQQRPSS